MAGIVHALVWTISAQQGYGAVIYKGCNLQGQLAVAAGVARWRCRILGANANGINKTQTAISINTT